MIEGSTQIGEATISVQDEQVMVYFPGGEGTSIPCDSFAVEKLEFIARIASLHHGQTQATQNGDRPDLHAARSELRLT